MVRPGSLLAALGVPDASVDDLAADVALASDAYQPHTPQSADAAAADRLVAACGGRTEQAAARVCVLVQADAACTALAADAHFGRAVHQCPGEALALRLAHEDARR